MPVNRVLKIGHRLNLSRFRLTITENLLEYMQTNAVVSKLRNRMRGFRVKQEWT